MPRTPEQEAAIAAHCDEGGRPVLVGPECPTCGLRATVRYRCLVCDRTWDVPGAYRWHWQGFGHWHDADDRAGWNAPASDHVRDVHGGRGGIVPDPEETQPAHSLPHSHPGSDGESEPGGDRA